MVSIIIRTRNEERWIAQVLEEVFSQRYKNFEVILVDNESTDKTVEKARQFNIQKVLTCGEYLPGKALNMGIRASRGEYIVSLSGHCIPVDGYWLERLLDNFSDAEVAGVYGRQEAMAFTADSDKRDLALIFGLDRKIQKRDSFFHNANSVMRRKLLDEIPFDETVTNIEDRVWAERILKKGYKIVYEPQASVYHYHGIHQNGDVERCVNVVRILESLKMDRDYRAIDAEKLNVVAMIPVKGPVRYINGRPLLSYTIQRALESKYIKRTIVSTDDEEVAGAARKAGAEVPFMRDPSFSKEYVDLARVLQYSLEEIEKNRIFPDVILSLEITFPFRPRGLLDEMITQIAERGLDSIIAAKKENKSIWKEKDGKVIQLDEGIVPRKFKEPSFIGLKGLGCLTHTEFLRNGNLLGNKIGIYEVECPFAYLEVRSEKDSELASPLLKRWFK